MNWLKKAVVDANAPKFGLIDVMNKNLGGYSPARSHEVVHASDVTKPHFCPRKYALWDVLKKFPKDEYASTAMQATYDVGNATARLVVENCGILS